MIKQYNISQVKTCLGRQIIKISFKKNNSPTELHQNIQTLHFNPDHLNLIRGAIERDPVHEKVYRLTLNGWPDKMRDVAHIACNFLGYKR